MKKAKMVGYLLRRATCRDGATARREHGVRAYPTKLKEMDSAQVRNDNLSDLV